LCTARTYPWRILLASSDAQTYTINATSSSSASHYISACKWESVAVGSRVVIGAFDITICADDTEISVRCFSTEMMDCHSKHALVQLAVVVAHNGHAGNMCKFFLKPRLETHGSKISLRSPGCVMKKNYYY
jgi:hypothetical protein